MKHPIKKTLLLSCLALSVRQAWAEEAAAPAEQEMAVVTVSAGRGSRLDKMDLATTVMTREQVEQAPETSVEQILNKIPGLFARQEPAAMIHPTGQAFSIRGFGTVTNVNTLVTVDGLPINDPYFRTIDWGQVPKDAVERIEIIRGGGAATLWGNLAMGGIVNIVTRRPVAGEQRINVSYGSFNALTTDAAATLVATPTLTMGLSGGWSHSDGYQLTPAKYRSPGMDSTASRTSNIALTSYIAPSSGAKYYVKLLAHQSHEDSVPWRISNNDWKKYQLSAGGSHVLDDGAGFHWNGWYNQGEMDTVNSGATPAFNILKPEIGTPYVSQIEQAKYSSLGGSAFYQRDAGDWKELRVGLDWRQIRADDHINVFNATGQTAALVNEGTHRFVGVFAQASYRPREIPLDVTIGLREDFFQTSAGRLSGAVGGNPVATELADQSFHHFDPRVGAKYYFANGIDVRAAVYRNFAAPGMNQMYRSFVSGASFTATNPGLKPQTNFGQEIGIDYVRPGLNLALTVFNNDLKNFIDYGPLCGSAAACNGLLAGSGLAVGSITSVNQYVNAGDAVIRGVELIGDWQVAPALQLHGGFTRTVAHLVTSAYAALPTPAAPAVPVQEQIGQVPRWVANLGATWHATSKLTLSMSLKAFPDYWYNTAHNTLNTGATLLDAGFTYRLKPGVELYGSAQNLGSKDYYDQGLATTTKEGSTLNTGTVPQRGTPLSATLGVRMSF